MEISLEKVQVILALIDRVQLSGKEAMTVASIQQELAKGLEVEAPKKEEPKK